MKNYFLTLMLFLFSLQLINAEEARILRYPNSSDTHISFVHGGDIYTVPIAGGIARRITSSDGIEMYPRFSRDGSKIAFTAEYDGNREIYRVPSIGGQPERLTYSMDIEQGLPERMGPDKIIMQWTKDDEVLYRGRSQSFNVLVGDLFLVDTVGRLPEKLPLPRGGYASLSPDENKIAYNRIFREYRTWKRYRGGQADDIWIYDFQTKELKNITDNPAQDIIPMWVGNKIYYMSDRDDIMNLFSYDVLSGQTKKVTDFTEFDVKFPSIGTKHIAFQNGGYVYLLDPATDEYNKINIEIANDFPNARNTIVNVKDKITSYGIAPDGKRALFTGRGDIFTVPKEKGNIVNLTKNPGAHDRSAVWSPDGKWIAFISDKSGEDEIYLVKPDGSDMMQLTDDAQSYRYGLMWSPDSKKILCSDKSLRLYYVDIATKKTTEVRRSKQWEITEAAWSPDSKWIAFTDLIGNYQPVVYLYNLNSKETTPVTDEFFASSSPLFSPGGKYLFFVSDREFKGETGAFEYNFVFNEMSKIYGVTLQDTSANPFVKYESDIVGEDDKKSSKKDKEQEDIRIDLEGIQNRIFEFPVPAANYSSLTATKDHKMFYFRTQENQKRKLFVYDFPEKEEHELGEVNGYEISFDNEWIIFRKDKDYFIEKLTAKPKPEKGKLALDKMEVKLDKKAEWNQIFDEAWRQMKYFFYDPNMHGLDWDAVYKRYKPLVDHVVHRADLTYIIGEMIGELNVGHAYVGGGDAPKVEEVPIGLLGAEFELDEGSGFYKFTKIFPGRNWDTKTRSPLTEPGINIKEGDYLIAIDDNKLTAVNHPFKELVNKANAWVKLTYNSSPSQSGAKEVWVKTIDNESGLRYFDWVEGNLEYVTEKTNGRVGYIHIPDMGFSNGLNEFVKYFYPQIRKEALIIDDRYNGGGNVSPMIIERLRRELAVVKNARNQQMVFTTPNAVMTGPMVCLINEQSMSDGDLFPYQFKRMGLGKVIGKRSWGGVIGIRGSLPFLDGGYLYKPEFANFGVDSEWILEGVGMVPDIEVDNHPARVMAGEDQQLDKGIEVIMEELKTDRKPKIPSVPPYPDKSPNRNR